MSAPAPLRILGVAGSLREASFNRRLVRLAASIFADDDSVVFTEFTDVASIEAFDEDLEPSGTPAGAEAFKDAIREADAVLVATPEYNASVPGALKNAFDWASRADAAPFNELRGSPMYGVPVAVVSASTGQFGGVWARDEFMKSLRTQGARAVDEPKVTIPTAQNAFLDSGKLANAGTQEQFELLLANLVDQTRAVLAARARNAQAAAGSTT